MSNGRYRAYPEYKDSGLPWMTEVPAHWIQARFKHVLADKKKVLRPDLPAGSISFGRVVYKDTEVFSEETKASYQEVLAGEFLVNPLNLNYDLLSLRTALSSINVVVSTGYIVLQSTGRLHPNYTRWLLQQFDVAHMKTLGAGVRQTINYADIGNSYFFEPPLPEQTQIAKFLDHETAKIDRLIEKQEALIRLLNEKRQAVISHAVTKGLNPQAPLRDSGIEWLGPVPAHWKLGKLGWFAFMQEGPGLRNWQFTDSGVRVICVTNITDEGINFQKLEKFISQREYRSTYQHFTVAHGDILVSSSGNSWGKVARYELPDLTILNTSTIRVNRLHNEPLAPDYLEFLLQTDTCREQLGLAMTGSCQPNFGPTHLKEIKVPVPEKSEQRAIVDYLAKRLPKFDRPIEAAQEAVILLQERRTALISAAVTGKIDVRAWQPSGIHN